ncbi:hypothetical protein [Streptomyces sp. NPDC001930]|uniref:hypothetical protein n=1 Tax=Streptomyces sp. NPDC001930 TaxID=3364625 RepID=UPI0036987727
MPKQAPAAFSSAFVISTAKLGTAAQDTGPTPLTRRPPIRELPRTGRRGASAAAARNRFQTPRRTY